jgi:hypothetical protein
LTPAVWSLNRRQGAAFHSGSTPIGCSARRTIPHQEARALLPKQQVNARSTVEAANLSHFAIPSEAAIALFERISQRRSPPRTIRSTVPREIGWPTAHRDLAYSFTVIPGDCIEFKRIDKRSVMVGKRN